MVAFPARVKRKHKYISLACAATSASGLKKCSPETKNNEIEESLKALEKSAIEINRLMKIGTEEGLGHQNYGVENEGWEMEDHQLRDVCSLLTLGYREVNLKDRVQKLDYRNQSANYKLFKSS